MARWPRIGRRHESNAPSWPTRGAQGATGRGWLPSGADRARRESDGEAGPARLRGETEPPPVGLDDPAGDVEPESGALTHRLGGEEGLEEPGLHVVGNPGSVILNGYDHLAVAHGDGHCDPPATAVVDGVSGVVEEVGPHLVELAARPDDDGEVVGVVANHGDSLQLAPQHGQGVVE